MPDDAVGQDKGVATHDLASPPTPVTMIGLPTITGTIATRDAGVPGELAAKLWDVDEKAGRQSLVTKKIYRLAANQASAITFQLNGSAWAFNPGHHAHLEIAGRDDASWRPSNNTDFTVEVANLTLTLPTAGRPRANREGSGGVNRWARPAHRAGAGRWPVRPGDGERCREPDGR